MKSLFAYDEKKNQHNQCFFFLCQFVSTVISLIIKADAQMTADSWEIIFIEKKNTHQKIIIEENKIIWSH